ncbi:MAG: response regulator transcription factor [Acidimicrobiia bacterium]|nr:response regulator transcription factor [Acidimicrobiia bacterium]
MRLLLAEDDDSIAEPLVEGLRRDGFAIERVATGSAALDARGYDFALLDLGLPDMDGAEVCRKLREDSDVPIIVITARSDEIDRVLLLELGADDYVVKPFGFRELTARIRAVSRRAVTRTNDASPARIGALEVDRRTRRAVLGDEELQLTPKEFDLLALLASDAGAVLDRPRIMDEVWDQHWYGPTKTLDVHVASLRKKLGDPAWIETVRGVGFRLVDPS